MCVCVWVRSSGSSLWPCCGVRRTDRKIPLWWGQAAQRHRSQLNLDSNNTGVEVGHLSSKIRRFWAPAEVADSFHKLLKHIWCDRTRAKAAPPDDVFATLLDQTKAPSLLNMISTAKKMNSNALLWAGGSNYIKIKPKCLHAGSAWSSQSFLVWQEGHKHEGKERKSAMESELFSSNVQQNVCTAQQ